ncbi:MAG: ECF-type sigma factor, partial [Holophagales bacterium]|nr:ECF-type sigma factor [Holophagales bacterium]
MADLAPAPRHADTAPQPAASGEITHLLRAWSAGDLRAGEALIPRIYGEMRKIAAGNLFFERRNHTLQPTELVNEAFLRLLREKEVSWDSRAHFFAAAARVVRRLLVEHARRASTARRGGGERPLALDAVADLAGERPDLLVELDEALGRLKQADPELAVVVEYRFFAGMSGAEIAE